MKLNVNKKLLATLVAGSIALSLTGCSCAKQESSSEELIEKEKIEQVVESEESDKAVVEEKEETNNVINNNEAKEQNYIYLLPTNIPDNAYISLSDGTNTPLNTFNKSTYNSYMIPSNDFIISFEIDNITYSYTIQGEYNTTVCITNGYEDKNEPIFYVEKVEHISMDELKSLLSQSNINLSNFSTNNNDYNLFKRTNITYKDYIIDYENDSVFMNDILLYEEVFENNEYNYYSPFKRGNGNNTLEIVDNMTLRLTYDNKYTNTYEVIDRMEKNVNYFFNMINNTKDINYFQEGYVDLAEIINEDTTINEHIETYFNGHENGCIRYSYNIGGTPLLEFGQVSYDNDYYIEDFNGNVNLYPQETKQKVR